MADVTFYLWEESPVVGDRRNPYMEEFTELYARKLLQKVCRHAGKRMQAILICLVILGYRIEVPKDCLNRTVIELV